MDLIYELWAANRGIKGSDLSDGFKWPLDNLGLSLRRFLQTQPGIFRGGKVKQTAVASKNVIVEPLAGISPSNELLILDNEVTLAVPDNASVFSRRDLVSVYPATVDSAGLSRAFWNKATQTAFTQNTVVSRSLKATPVYTVGVPSGTPTAQPLPAGHVALATVLVGPGFSSVVDADITRSIAPEPLQVLAFDGPGGTNVLPYEPAQQLSISVRDGGLAVVFAHVTLNDGSSFDPTTWRKLLQTSIVEVGGAAIVDRKDRLFQGDSRGLFLIGPVIGPKSLAKFKLRFEEGAGTGTAYGSVNLSGKCVLGAVTL